MMKIVTEPKLLSAEEKRAMAAELLRKRAERESWWPLTYGQQAIWFFENVAPGSAAYHVSFSARICSPFVTRKLVEAFQSIEDRYPVLRARVVERDGEMVQQAREPGSVDFAEIDSTGMTDAQLREVMAREYARPFDLIGGRLLRVRLFRRADADAVLLVVVHHIACDLWSLLVLLDEVRIMLAGGQVEIPRGPTFAEHARRQRKDLSGEEGALLWNYWREHLAGDLAPLDLPFDRPRPAVQTFRGASLPFSLPAQLSARVEELGRSTGTNLFVVLQAAFQILLHRYTGQEDFVVGTLTNGRPRADLAGTIGHFMNPVVLRARPAVGISVADFIRNTAQEVLGAVGHQDYPYRLLVDRLQQGRNASRSGLYDVLFIFQQPHVLSEFAGYFLEGYESAPREFGGLMLAPFHQPQQEGQLDLVLEAAMFEGRVRGTLKYNTDLFDRETAEAMARHLANLLEGMVEDPGCTLSKLPLLSQDERRTMLCDWNDTALAFPEADRISDQFERQAASFPENVAVVAPDRSLTYVELQRHADWLARHLAGAGAGPGELIGICLHRTSDLPAAILGVLKAGAAYVPLDPAFPRERLAFMMADAGIRIVILHEDLRTRLPEWDGVELPLDRFWTDHAGNDSAPFPCPAKPEDLAYVMYTSGSTGQPKGVMIEHRNVVNFFAGMDRVLGQGRPGVWLAVTSQSFDISVLELVWTLTRGYRVIIHDDSAPGKSTKAARATPWRPIDFSLFYFSGDGADAGENKYDLLLEGARFADTHGFAAVWTPERHFHSFGGLYPNPAVLGAALAVTTERVKIRAGSVVLPLHHPIRVAEEWSVVDNLSGGRTEISFASGWHSDDFVFAPEKYSNRQDAMLRAIDEVRRLWRGEHVAYRGGAGNSVEVGSLPRPVQPELRFWITAAGNPETFRLAGRLGAGLLTHLLGQNLDTLDSRIKAYREAWRVAGHEGSGRVAIMLHTYVGDDLESVRETARGPFCQYLRSSLDLVGNLARSMGSGIDPAELEGEALDRFIDRAYERYFNDGALMGTPATCEHMLTRLAGLGVDEVACLIDFGIDAREVAAGLERLNEVRERWERRADSEDDRKEASIAELIERHGVTHLQCTPSLARMLTADAQAVTALGRLHKLLIGGEALPPDLAHQLTAILGSCELLNMYGPTETTIWSTAQKVNADEESVPIGRPIANTAAYILDNNAEPVPAGVAGELWIGGKGVARGYKDRAELTAERFVADPFSRAPGARLYRTGDLACFRRDGTICFLGRRDQQVKLRGHRVELGEIESTLCQHPQIHEAIVTLREDRAGDPYLAAYVAQHRTHGTGAHAMTLPNGLTIRHNGVLETRILYREIFEDQMYLRHGIKIADGACIIDAGANVGLFSLWVSRQARDVELYCFEPIPPSFALLQENLQANGVAAHVFSYGLSDREEEAEFLFYPEASGLSGRFADQQRDRAETAAILDRHRKHHDPADESQALLDDHFTRKQTYNCRLRTLSSVIREQDIDRIDLLKIDVERSEALVLRGIDEDLWTRIAQIVMEVHSLELLREVKAILDANNFHVEIDSVFSTNQVNIFMVHAVQPETKSRMSRARKKLKEQPAVRDVTADALRDYLKARLPAHMVPSVFVTLESMPLTPNGKIDRAHLPAPHSSPAPGRRESAPPATPAEKMLAQLWCQVLQTETVGREDNFFEVGGHSLRAIELAGSIRRTFQIDLPVNRIFGLPVLCDMARLLEESLIDQLEGLTEEEAEQSLAQTGEEYSRPGR